MLKFGGTSVGRSDRICQVVRIVCQAAATHRVVVVASAASEVTDTLAQALDTPSTPFSVWYQYLFTRYGLLAQNVLDEEHRRRYTNTLVDTLGQLQKAWEADRRDQDEGAFRDLVLAAGERLSVPLLALALEEAGLDAEPIDASVLIRTDSGYGAATVDQGRTRQKIESWYKGLGAHTIPVVTGFIGADAEGQTTTLGRGGSDYTASLLAAFLGAKVLERWTDVEGLYTADPSIDPDATPINFLTMERAHSWNEAGKLGMHAHTLEPLLASGIPLHVRSTFAPESPGTLLVSVVKGGESNQD